MRTATGLAVMAAGAILALAVNGHPSFLNIQAAGWVLIVVGAAGIFVPRRGNGWLRRRQVLRRGPRGPVVQSVDEQHYPPYLMVSPPPAPGRAPVGLADGEHQARPQPGPVPGDMTLITSGRVESETIEEFRED